MLKDLATSNIMACFDICHSTINLLFFIIYNKKYVIIL